MIRITLMTFLVLFSCQSLATKIYKWVDENGQIHYSSNKPANQETETVKVRKGPKAVAKTSADEVVSSDESKSDGSDNSSEMDAEAKAAAKKELAAADRINRKKQCDVARKNYNSLNATVRVVRTNEKGETVRMTDDERVNALATAKKAMNQYCK